MVPLNRLPVVALAAPGAACLAVLCVALFAAVTVGYRPMAAPLDLTLSEAAALRDHGEILRQVRAGEDPNARRRVRENYLRGTDVQVTPLEAAIAVRRVDVFDLLVALGARVDARTLPELWCFAEQLGAGDVLERLDARSRIGRALPDCTAVVTPW
jgi:hypothetical protein